MNDPSLLPAETATPDAPPSDAMLIVRVAAQFDRETQTRRGQAFLDNGERARLRRYDPEKPQLATKALVVRLLIMAGADDTETCPRNLARWTLLLHLLALLASTRENARPNRPDASFGEALFVAKVSEKRVLALLAARGAVFDALLDRTIRRLAVSGVEALYAVKLWRLMRNPDGETSDKERLAVARDYFSAQAKDAKSAA